MKRFLLIATFVLGSTSFSLGQVDGLIFAIVDMVCNFEEVSVETKFTDMDGRVLPMYGIEGGMFDEDGKLMLGSSLLLGTSSQTTLNKPITLSSFTTSMFLEYRFLSNERRTFIAPRMEFGYGGTQRINQFSDAQESAGFYFIEPGIGGYLQVTDWFKLGARASYRYSGINWRTGSEVLRLNGAACSFSVIFS